MAQPIPASTAPEPAPSRVGLVLVTTFQPVQPGEPGSARDAERLFGAVSARVAQTHPLLPMSHVPAFESQGYGADVYMLGCPPERYAGCGLVLGQRAEADWVLGATVRRDPDEFVADQTVLVLDVHMIDVRGATEVASFGLVVRPDREDDAVEGIGQVLDEILRGDYVGSDLRSLDDPEAKAREAAQKQALAASLAALEARLGTPIRPAPSATLEAPRLTRDDLTEYQERDDAKPWERAGLTESAYLRFANSGLDLQTWRERGEGRFGKLLLRAGAGYGYGPWQQRYESDVLLSNQNLLPVAKAQILEVVEGGSLTGDLEVGFGVAPIVDVAAAVAAHSGVTTLNQDEQVEDQPVVRPPATANVPMTTWTIGVRAQITPLPRAAVRPTVALGIARWTGAGTPATVRFDALDRPSAWLVELIPGVEIDVDDPLAFTVRGAFTRALVSSYVRGTTQNPTLLPGAPTAGPAPIGGFQVVAGVLIRIGPLIDRRRP